MRDSRFDDILKNKLNGLTSDKQPDWGLFAQEKHIADKAMGGLDAEDITFDAQILSELDAYETPGTPDWAAFLDKKIISDNNLDFDNKLKQELEQQTTSSEPQWGAFVDFKNKKEAVDQPATEVEEPQDFDAVVRTSLEDYQPHSSPQWSTFLEKKEQSDTDYQIDGTHKDFDDDVRAAVAGLVVTSPSDWSAFTDLRNDLGFDTEIRESLEDHTNTGEPQWERFLDDRGDLSFDSELREELEGHETVSEPQWEKFLDDKGDLTFDSDVREEIEGYTTNTKPQWEKFLERKRRDDEIAPAAGFDQGVSGTLGRMKVRYNSEHWLLLRARLQRIAELRKGIFSYKGLEMLFVSLMLFTMANHLSPLMDKLVKEDTTSVIAENKIEHKETLTAAVEQGERVEPQLTAVLEKENSEGSSIANQAKSKAKVIPTDARDSEQKSGRSAIPPSDGGTSGEQLTSPTSNRSDKVLPAIAAESNKVDKENAALAAQALMAKLDLIPDGLDIMDDGRALKRTSPIEVIDYTTKKTYKDDGNWLHLFAAMESDLIKTPYAEDTGLRGRGQNTFGYAFEGLYSVVKGPWEYELGLGYNYFNYTPHTIYGRQADGEPSGPQYQSEDGMNSIVFDKISLNMVSVPLKVKHHFLMNGRWSVFGSVGVSNDFLAVAKYEVVDKIESNTPMTIPPTTGPQPEYPVLYTERLFTQGFLNSDPLSFNREGLGVKTRSNFYFLRATIGAGAERNISDYVAAYVRADYHETLVNREFGPFNDRINKWSFGMGFKFRMQ